MQLNTPQKKAFINDLSWFFAHFLQQNNNQTTIPNNDLLFQITNIRKDLTYFDNKENLAHFIKFQAKLLQNTFYCLQNSLLNPNETIKENTLNCFDAISSRAEEIIYSPLYLNTIADPFVKLEHYQKKTTQLIHDFCSQSFERNIKNNEKLITNLQALVNNTLAYNHAIISQEPKAPFERNPQLSRNTSLVLDGIGNKPMPQLEQNVTLEKNLTL